MSERSKSQKKGRRKISKSTISRSTTIGEILQRFPNATEIMLNFGLRCVGCSMNVFESLEEGARSHGMNEKMINGLVSELNHHASERSTREDSLKELILTKIAAKKVQEYAKMERKKGYGLRIEVIPGGCAGYQYYLNLEKHAKKGDRTYSFHDVDVFIPDTCIDLIRGSVIDYLDTIHGSGFKVDNPNVGRRYGCGNSFG